jgi:ABC-2 type transport system ATP-binding protein
MTATVSAAGLRKQYGALQALRGVDLEVSTGEVFALLGPNGAGKTTFVEILEGYRRRSAGSVSVLGTDPERATPDWRSRIGIVLQNTAVFDALTVEEVVSHFATFYPAPRPPRAVITAVGLDEKRRARCGTLSGGQKRRVDLALGIVGDPELVFLDEPTTGLDPEGRRQLWDVVRGFAARGTTIILTTHYLEEAEALADRVGIIIQGSMAAIGPPAEVGAELRSQATIRFRPPRAGAHPTSWAVGEDGFASMSTSTPTAVLRDLMAWATAHGLGELPDLAVVRPSLEDVYLQMVARAADGGQS